MNQYTVRSGQNIYDVAMTLYGSVEGIFDLLVSNEWLNMETKLSYGMVLNYHEELAINNDVTIWLKDNGVLVKNGEHVYNYLNIEKFIRQHFESYHPELIDSLQLMSPDEQNMFWETLYTPRMIVQQQGQISAIKMRMRPGKHLILDWGDYMPPQIIEGEDEQEIEHCYKGTSKHVITFYGDFEFAMLDFSNLNGVYYPLGTIYADKFISALKIEELNKLIITQ